jgi:hypothetical protein
MRVESSWLGKIFVKKSQHQWEAFATRCVLPSFSRIGNGVYRTKQPIGIYSLWSKTDDLAFGYEEISELNGSVQRPTEN